MRRHRETSRMDVDFPTDLIMHHIHIFYLFRVWTGTPLVSRPHPSAFRLLSQHGITANFTKMRKQQRSAWALPSVTEWLDSQFCWQRFYSETAPPCRLCDGSPVCCVGALPPGHNSARGILHTIALLFGCQLCTIYTWPHLNSVRL